jgi:glycosyltransferase involved in cell wall biosynthesis
VVPLAPIPRPRIVGGFIARFDKFCQAVFKKKYFRDQNRLRARYYAKFLKKKLQNESFDLIFSAASSCEIAYLKTNLPIFKYDDSTFHQMIDYYPAYENIASFSLKEADAIEKKAIDKSVVTIYSSEWAQADSIQHYKRTTENSKVAKLGADIVEGTQVDKNFLQSKNYDGTINILFIGRHWDRKRGDLVLETLTILLDKGHNVQLTVAGCVPPVTHERMKVYPFLDKNKASDFEIFTQIFKESHFLFVPSLAECYGLVFCEAFAYGVPVITTNTGGIPAIVEHKVNGIALDVKADANAYANEIETLITHPDQLKAFSLKALEKFHQELNWTVWTETVTQIIHNYFEQNNEE